MKAALVTAAGALAVAVLATAVVRPAERASAQTSMSYGKVLPRKCKDEANKVVACTSKLRAKTQRKKANGSVWGASLGDHKRGAALAADLDHATIWPAPAAG